MSLCRCTSFHDLHQRKSPAGALRTVPARDRAHPTSWAVRPPWGASRPWLLIRLRLFETLGASSRSCPQQRRLELIAYGAGQQAASGLSSGKQRAATARRRFALVAAIQSAGKAPRERVPAETALQSTWCWQLHYTTLHYTTPHYRTAGVGFRHVATGERHT